MKWSNLIGKKVVAFRGYKITKYGKEEVTFSFVLFDDRKSYLSFFEQDPYDYHDCNSSARRIDFYQDEVMWQKMFNKDGFEEHEGDTADPF